MNNFKGFGQGGSKRGGFGGQGFGGSGFGQSPFGTSGDIRDGIKESFRTGSDMTKLIYINIGVFIALKLLTVLGFLFGIPNLGYLALDYLAVPSDTTTFLTKPWTLLTYMFVHEGFMHLLFNMLWLFWFGRLFHEFLGRARLSAVYLLGGLTGAGLFIIAYNIFPAFQVDRYSAVAIGASASVMAIVFSVAFYNPSYKIYIFLVGPVKLIHIAIITIAIDILSLPAGNAGGHIAHLGGALYGYLFAINYKKGKDISIFFFAVLDWVSGIFNRKPRMKVKYGEKKANSMDDREYNANKKGEQDRINLILDKISKSGYESLTAEEKQILFKSGRR